MRLGPLPRYVLAPMNTAPRDMAASNCAPAGCAISVFSACRVQGSVSFGFRVRVTGMVSVRVGVRNGLRVGLGSMSGFKLGLDVGLAISVLSACMRTRSLLAAARRLSEL